MPTTYHVMMYYVCFVGVRGLESAASRSSTAARALLGYSPQAGEEGRGGSYSTAGRDTGGEELRDVRQ